MTRVYINKTTFRHDFDMMLLGFIALSSQFYYLLAYGDQGDLFQVIKNKEFLIYAFSAFVGVYVFWKLASKNNGGFASVVLAVLTPAAISVHFITYHTILRFSVTGVTPQCVEELVVLLFDSIKTEFMTAGAKYIIEFVILLALCLYVAIKTPAEIRHKCHVLKMNFYKKQGYSMYELTDLERDVEIIKRSADNIVIAKDGGVAEYDVNFKVRDYRNRDTYLVFSSDEMNENKDSFIAYVGKCNRNDKTLMPVDNQSIFDAIENVLYKH